MKTRHLLVAATVLPLVAGVAAADAAPKRKPKPKPKPACNLLNDARDDATGTGTSAAGPNEPTLDIVSADLATNATTLTAVFRMAEVDATPNTSPFGRGWDMSFVVKGNSVVIRSYTGPLATTWARGAGTGVVDAAKKEVRVSVPIAKLSTQFKPGDKITELRASSWRYIASDMFGKGDQVDGTTPYVAAWPSCVKVGV